MDIVCQHVGHLADMPEHAQAMPQCMKGDCCVVTEQDVLPQQRVGGSEEPTFILAVRENAVHGMPCLLQIH